ncbi:MAG: hypothetical protein DRI34_01685 [Deltaproteobacteria bacterium]|nr:MAG: hypothetical protein DRI34_01685 [Deltaproteobacteria bacterium]
MDKRLLLKNFTRQHAPHWEEPFRSWVDEEFPEQLPEKASLLELCCSDGGLTRLVAERLPEGGRLIATDDIRELMDLARQQLGQAIGKKVFFKRETPEELSFAPATFDGIYCAGLPPAYRLDRVLAESSRLLRKDGFLLLGVAMQGSFCELLDVFREVLEKEDLISAQDELDRLLERFPRRGQLQRLLSAHGFIDGRIKQRTYTMKFERGLELVSSVLVQRHCLEACLELIADRGWREGILAGMVRSLDTYFPGGIELTIEMGRLQADKL